jgi:uncharacterized membrane protein
MEDSIKSPIKTLLRYFLQGLFVLAPIAITVYILVRSLYFIDTWMDNFMETYIPGLGTAIIVVGVTLLGYLTSTFIAKPILSLIESGIAHVPFVNIIYKSIKDLFSAIFGNNSTFKQPVLVTLNKELQIQKIGFITKKDLSEFGITDKIAVYFPHSYNISGNLYIVPKDNVEPLHMNGAEIMKFVVSGGMAGFKNET